MSPPKLALLPGSFAWESSHSKGSPKGDFLPTGFSLPQYCGSTAPAERKGPAIACGCFRLHHRTWLMLFPQSFKGLPDKMP